MRGVLVADVVGVRLTDVIAIQRDVGTEAGDVSESDLWVRDVEPIFGVAATAGRKNRQRSGCQGEFEKLHVMSFVWCQK